MADECKQAQWLQMLHGELLVVGSYNLVLAALLDQWGVGERGARGCVVREWVVGVWLGGWQRGRGKSRNGM
jgi:hypothetical protein